MRVRSLGFLVVCFLAGCGGGGDGGGKGGDGEDSSGGVSGAGSPGAGGAPSGAGGSGAPSSTGGNGQGGGLVGLDEACAAAQGALLATGPCAKTCRYNGGKAPFYDDGGDCARLGYKCSAVGYCIPNVHCAVTAACESQGGPGWQCATVVGPFEGECLLGCATTADCPASNDASPYACKPVDAIPVCRH